MAGDNNHYCPKCGVKAFCSDNNHLFYCTACEFRFYHNVAATVSVVLCHGREILFSKRGRDPSRGLLDFPGGFVDPGESLEEALSRELLEELDWAPVRLDYLFSFPNIYPYGDIVYSTADTFFLSQVESKPDIFPSDDVEAVVWSSIEVLNMHELAFGSMKKAVSKLSEMGY